MRHADDVAVTVDRGAYPDAITPWERQEWREAAVQWAERGAVAAGLRPSGGRSVRLRPWSVLVRFGVAGRGAVWFKANPPASSFEAGLTAALARWVPGHVLTPLAVDADRGWSLLPDGGTLLRDVLAQDGADPRTWEEPLRQYARMQRELLPRVQDLERLGVPRARTPDLPDVFDGLVAGNDAALDEGDRIRLRALRPRLADWCGELATAGVTDSLDHADLHDGQLFHAGAGRYTFFDWGDALVSHPFCSFLVPARRARARYGPEVLPRLRDAYLEPWTGGGRTSADLRRALTLATRLGALGRACSWGRLFPGASAGAEATGRAQSAEWLLRLCADPWD
ncbi:phosphotransferase [Streptomyces tropicalis]|uniref:Phosphotransferase n=1 Tax=Streptomyces tropicalis TaxID=3034234 RepID=A0ABT6A767_9ACTN|nr:phosphotransferase [Streptomyces tropicalis]MDF3300292.1 phosphotransferase [Streptomyces tropicalis]